MRRRHEKTWIETVGNYLKALNVTDRILWIGPNGNIKFMLTNPINWDKTLMMMMMMMTIHIVDVKSMWGLKMFLW